MYTPSKLLNNVNGIQERIYEFQTDEANTIFQFFKVLFVSNSMRENKCGESNTKP
jgi:hypothetical protein